MYFRTTTAVHVKNGYLTPPIHYDAAIAHYDFSLLTQSLDGEQNTDEIALNELIHKHPRVTKAVTEQIIQLSQDRQGVMIFAATIEHAQEISGYLPAEQTALITGTTKIKQRDGLIAAFKAKKIKYLVNVSVLTTGFDAPHVDVIAILRPHSIHQFISTNCRSWFAPQSGKKGLLSIRLY